MAVVVGLEAERADLVGRLEDGLEDELQPEAFRCAEAVDDGRRIPGNLNKRFQPVMVRAAGDEPDFGRGECDHVREENFSTERP